MKKKFAFVSCYFNPCNYVSKYFNFINFVNNIPSSEEYDLHLIEAFNNDSKYRVKKNFDACQEVFCESIYWQKEQLLNKLINQHKHDYQFIGWFDGDIIFEKSNWFENIKLASKKHDFFQIFTKVKKETNFRGGLQTQESTMSMITDDLKNMEYGEPGYGYVYNTELFRDTDTPLYQNAILGTGDFLNMSANLVTSNFNRFAYNIRLFKENNDFLNDFLAWESTLKKAKNPGVANNTLRILYHGSIGNRKYISRESILRENKFHPHRDLSPTKNGMYFLNNKKLQLSIENYFKKRKEDDFFANAFHLTYFKKRVSDLILAFDPKFNVKSDPFNFLNKIKRNLNSESHIPKNNSTKIISVNCSQKEKVDNINYVKNNQENTAMFFLKYIIDNYNQLNKNIAIIDKNVSDELACRKLIADHVCDNLKSSLIDNNFTDVCLMSNLHLKTENKIKRSKYDFIQWYFVNFKSKPFRKQKVNDHAKLISVSKNIYVKKSTSFCIASSQIKKQDLEFYRNLYKKCQENYEECGYLQISLPYIFQ